MKKSAPKKTAMLRSLGSQAPAPTHETLSPQDNDRVNISDVDITNGTIDVEIANSGTYTLTGTNERNGAYVDVCIKVASPATVDLYFDGLNIVNDDSLVDSEQTTSYGYSDSISPIVVDGTVNLHISRFSRQPDMTLPDLITARSSSSSQATAERISEMASSVWLQQ